MEKKEQKFAFEKKIGVHDLVYGNISELLKIIEKLLYCMKESNQLNKVECEFFRLDFRQPYFDEQLDFPIGYLLLDMKWGSKEEIDKCNSVKNAEAS